MVNKPETVYGLHAVQALLLRAPQSVRQLYVLQGRNDSRLQKMLSFAKANDIHAQDRSRAQLDTMVDNQNHQGVAALCEVGERHDEAFLFTLIDRLDQPELLLVLDGVTDPHNLGACLRSAEAAGVNAGIAAKDKTAS